MPKPNKQGNGGDQPPPQCPARLEGDAKAVRNWYGWRGYAVMELDQPSPPSQGSSSQSNPSKSSKK